MSYSRFGLGHNVLHILRKIYYVYHEIVIVIAKYEGNLCFVGIQRSEINPEKNVEKV